MKRALVALVAAVVVTVSTSAFACGGGSPVTMTVSTTATFDPVPTNFVPAQDGTPCDEVM